MENKDVQVSVIDDTPEVINEGGRSATDPILDQGTEVPIVEGDVNKTQQSLDTQSMVTAPPIEDVDFGDFEETAGLKFNQILDFMNPFSGGKTSPIKNYIKKTTDKDRTILDTKRTPEGKTKTRELTDEQKKQQLDDIIELTDKNKYIMYTKDNKPNYRMRNDYAEGAIYNMRDIEDGDDIDASIQAMTEYLEPKIQASRRGDDGVLHDEEVRRLAKILIIDPIKMRQLLTRPDGTTANSEEIVAMSMLLQQHGAKEVALKKKAKTFGATQEDIDAWADAFQMQSSILTKVMGYKAESGRATRIWGMAKGDLDTELTDQDFVNLALNGYDSRTLLDMMPDTDTAEGVTFSLKALKSLSKLVDTTSEYFVKSILSGVTTQAINTIGVASELSISVVDRYIAEAGTRAWILAGGSYKKDMIAVGEGTALLHGEILSVKQALKTAFEVAKTGTTYDGGKFIPNETNFQHPNKIWDGVLKFADVTNGGFMTSRVMGSVDAFGKVIAEQGEYGALAYRKAYQDTANLSKEGLDPNKANAFFQRQLENYLYNPTPSMVSEAQAFGKRATYQDSTRLGKKMRELSDMSQVGKFFMPFINTPISSFIKNFAERVPVVGFIPPAIIAQGQGRGMNLGEAQMATARQITGGAIILSMYGLAENGQIQGSRPDWKTKTGRREYDVWVAQKRKEMSYLTDDEWQLQIKRIEQISYLGQTVADLRKLSEEKDYEYLLDESDANDKMIDYTESVVKSLMQNMEDKTFLQGLSMFFEGVDKGYGNFLMNVGSGLTPASGLRRNITQNFFLLNKKDASDGFKERLQQNMLWMSENLPDQLDMFATPIAMNPTLTPIKYGDLDAKVKPTDSDVTRKQKDILDTLYTMSQVVHKVPFGKPERMYKGVKLKAQEYHDYIEFSRRDITFDGFTFTEKIYDIIKSEEFKASNIVGGGDMDEFLTEETGSKSQFNVLQHAVRAWDVGAMKIFIHEEGAEEGIRADGEPIEPNLELLKRINKNQRIMGKKIKGINLIRGVE